MMRQLVGACVAAWFASVAAASVASAQEAPTNRPIPAHIQFNRDIRPILSENCYSCHGPDIHQRKADLRLDTRAGLFDAIKDRHPVVPGNVATSELFRRITATDPDERMPDPKSNKKLTDHQIALIKTWIEQGASWQAPWAFIAPQKAELPEVKDKSWPRNPIDYFVLSRLEAQGLKPSPEADKATLIRRVTLDLTGLPPTPGEVQAFIADPSPDAYEKVVDRLLADPHYGERMALDWLDAARFADTHGYHIDAGRDMSKWRQWVIDAFNRNEPFDQFTVEQLAGDLLPHPTVEQKIATGFNRNSMINFEGGAIPEEYLNAYLVDRVNTTSTVFLGMTLNCCQCHDHKFDPFTQKEYYEFYAFFNGIAEKGLDGQKGNAAPLLMLPTKQQQEKLAEVASAEKEIQQQLDATMPEADAAQAQWEQDLGGERKVHWTVLNPRQMTSAGGATFRAMADGTILVSGNNPPTDTYTITARVDLPKIAGIRIEALPDEDLNGKGPGRSSNGNAVLTDVKLSAGDDADALKPLAIASASADFSQDKFPVANAIDSDRKTGWAIFPQVGKRHEAVFALAEPVCTEKSAVLRIALDFQSQFSQHQLGRFRLAVTSSATPHGVNGLPEGIVKMLSVAQDHRSDSQTRQLRDYYRANFVPRVKALGEKLAKLKKEQEQIDSHVQTTMVMREMPKPRPTYLLMRGQYDKHGERVYPATPAALPPMPAGAPHNRLGLAEWIVSPSNPLPARVTANRIWQSLFGIGIVKTPGDFGSQGDPPSNQPLLDWLAVQFRDGDAHTTKWNVKALVRTIVTSATYRQSSVVTPALAARDPENRLLARGPRFRLQAEFIRDQALAISGLLDPEIGGESASPYQPPGLWAELMSRSDGAKWTAQVYVQSHGKDLYRRSMYTFWKRTSPPPSMSTFDAPDRETCVVRRSRTNTPLQALVLWNDPTFVEAARKMAERVMTEAGPGEEDRIDYAFELALARKPRPAEVAVLKNVFARQLVKYKSDLAAAHKLLTVGESPHNEKLDPPELAAWSMVCSTILNLDETLTKE